MVNFLKLGRYSVVSMVWFDDLSYYVYSHCTNTKGYGVEAYGWLFNTETDAVANMCENDEIPGQMPNPVDEDCVYKIIKKTKIPPSIYVDFKYKYMKYVLRNKIPVYHDYMDQGFSEVTHTDPDYKPKSFFNQDGAATMFMDEGLWIKKDDHKKIKRSYRKG